jgi:uncharacterized protein
MIKLTAAILYLMLCTGCLPKKKPETSANSTPSNGVLSLYSKNVQDSFFISTSFPADYDSSKKYPTVYVLDANLYFDICNVIMKKYSEVGLIPPAIVIGIGYKNFPAMDSLRNRDYTYPLAIPEYEMSTSGKADKFLSFITDELIPFVERKYLADTSNRILFGHSLGGYFTLYALEQSLQQQHVYFSGYIAASPSLHYNNYYLLKEFEKIGKGNAVKSKVYVAYGGLEDGDAEKDSTAQSSKKVLATLSKLLKERSVIVSKEDVYSNLDHMDTQIPSFIKGMQWLLQPEENK